MTATAVDRRVSVPVVSGPRLRHRVLAAVALGVLASVVMLVVWATVWEGHRSDFDMAWAGARALRAGVDPYVQSYELTTPKWPWPLAYPLPAILLSVPLAGLTFVWARVVFLTASIALLAFVLTRRAWWPLVFLVSGPAVFAIMVVQWSPLVTAASLLPFGGVLLACKPNLGLALWCRCRTIPEARRIAWAVLAVYAVTILFWPGWLGSYFVAAGAQPHVSPLLRPFGWVLLLALLRWRDPDARMLAALAILPQSASFYDALPVLLIAGTAVEGVTLAGLSLAGFLCWFPSPHGMPYAVSVAHGWLWALGTVYLPALVLVLRRRVTGRAAPTGDSGSWDSSPGR